MLPSGVRDAGGALAAALAPTAALAPAVVDEVDDPVDEVDEPVDVEPVGVRLGSSAVEVLVTGGGSGGL